VCRLLVCIYLQCVDTVHLQEDLDKLASWEQAWMMSFHPEKCNVLTVLRKRNIIKRDYTLQIALQLIVCCLAYHLCSKGIGLAPVLIPVGLMTVR
jgi:hypothetical protein